MPGRSLRKEFKSLPGPAGRLVRLTESLANVSTGLHCSVDECSVTPDELPATADEYGTSGDKLQTTVDELKTVLDRHRTIADGQVVSWHKYHSRVFK